MDNLNEPRTLSQRQSTILDELLDAYNRLKYYNGFTAQDLENLSPGNKFLFKDADKEYRKWILKAIRAGLHTHPQVEDRWKMLIIENILTRRAAGDRRFLRLTKLGIERGVKRPHSICDLELMNEYENLRTTGLSVENIRADLIAKEIVSRISRQALIKRIASLIAEPKVEERRLFINFLFLLKRDRRQRQPNITRYLAKLKRHNILK